MAVRAPIPLVALLLAASHSDGSLWGVYKLNPGPLHTLILDQLPPGGRPANGTKLSFHKSVPLQVELIPGKRPGEYTVKSMPDLRVNKLILPGYLNCTLAYGRRERPYRWWVTERRGKIEIQSQSSSTFLLKGYEIAFIDGDSDGVFGGPSDAYVVRGPKEKQWARPGSKIEFRGMKTPLEIEGTKVWFEVDPGGFRVIVTGEPPDSGIEKNSDYEEATSYLNGIRKSLGMNPVALDPDLSAACEKHALYCQQNELTHDEDRTKPGYTPEGERSGPRSVLTDGATTMREGVQRWLDSFFHRIGMLLPGLTAVGMGRVGRFGGMDVQSAAHPAEFAPFPWPYDGETDVPVGWDTAESPSPTGVEPFDMAQARQYGYPITVTFPTNAVSDVRVKLVHGKEDVPCFVSSPEKPSTPKLPTNLDSIFFMSRGELMPKTAYTATVECSYKGKPFRKEWTFTTH